MQVNYLRVAQTCNIITPTKTQKDTEMAHTNQRILTPNQVKARFQARGQTISAWARENGYRPQKVIRLLNGMEKGHYGQSHEIAVKLGLKAGVIESDTHAGVAA